MSVDFQTSRSWQSRRLDRKPLRFKALRVPKLKPAIVSPLFGLCCLAADVGNPERRVEHNVVVSEHDPKVRIELPKPVQYIGGDRFVLLEIADCELHAFVEANGEGKVRRLYWIQFEGYLPTKPELKHTYNSPWHTAIGGLDFYVDVWIRRQTDKITPGSDAEHLVALLRSKEYKLPGEMMFARLVHLLDKQKRKELMIIYAEDLASTGFTADELKKGGKAYDQWPAIKRSLVQRAKNRIRIKNAQFVGANPEVPQRCAARCESGLAIGW